MRYRDTDRQGHSMTWQGSAERQTGHPPTHTHTLKAKKGG